MPSREYEIIREAVATKKQVVATYQGHVREMCPHVIGHKNGREQALFYQFAGTSSSGPIVPDSPGNWRCIPISGLADILLRDGNWYTGSNHSRPQTCVDPVDLEVEI